MHRRIRANFKAALGAGAGYCLRDRAHAADPMAPDALLAVHLAPAMMQQDVTCARGIGAVVSPHNSVKAEVRLDRIALEPLVEHIAGRAGEKLEEVALPFEVERTQAVSDFGGVDEARRDWRRALVRSPDWAASRARARAERRSGARAAPRRRRAARRRGRRTWRPRPWCAPAPIFRYWPASRGRKLDSGRSTTRRPWRASSKSRITFGFNNETV